MSLQRNVISGEQVERELDEELHSFLDIAVEEKMKQGMSPQQAACAVRLERGSVESAKKAVRSARWESFAETCWQDLLLGTRILRKSPGFTGSHVVTPKRRLAMKRVRPKAAHTPIETPTMANSTPCAKPNYEYRF
jgi:hypothetical protein